uniref:DNA polymerase I n=1 Tax=Kamptonema TaxID=1501433 RepID=UPI0001DACCE2|nr:MULTISPECIES: DNA polymerase I [Kamptonema]CBN58695.1 DNA polymerase I [Kamptonema sp. PCC 6506]
MSISVLANQIPTFVLVDGHSLAFRSYYAFAKSRDGGLRTSTGIPTSASFGFLKSLLEVMAAEEPEYMAIAFDLGLPTFRHEADDTYKADRTETPEDFIIDLKNLQELLSYFHLSIVTAPGYEADDVLGTLAQRASLAGFCVKILTGDQDLFQLVNTDANISVLRLGRDSFGRGGTGRGQEYGPEQVIEKLGIRPDQVVDYKALCGDASDNIPGVRGIGEKTAVQLLTTYNSLDRIYASLDQVKGAVRKKLEDGKTEAYHSQHLAKIICDVPLEIELEECKLAGFDEAALIPVLEKLEFKTFLNKVKQLQKRFGGVEQSGEEASSRKIEEVDQDNRTTIKTEISEDRVSKENSDRSLSNNEDDASWFWNLEDTREAQQQAILPIKPRIIHTPEQLTELVQLLRTFTDSATPVAWDTETTALEPRDAELVGIGCCWGTGEADLAYIPTGHKTGQNLDKAIVLEALRPILEDNNYPKALQNAKFDRLILRCQGIKLAGVVFDTMLASYVIDPEGSHNLTALCKEYLEDPKLTAKSYKDLVSKEQTIADLAIPIVANYCGMDVYTTFQLVSKLREKLEELDAEKPLTASLEQLLIKVEQPLEPVLAQMEYKGIRINTEYLNELSQELENKLQLIEQTAYEVAGEEFSLSSPKQLSKLLFETLKLDIKKSRRIQSGYSTDAAVLEKLQDDHEVVKTILEHRTLSKLKSTYVDALPQLVRPDTGRVHTDFNQAATGTGRLSSSNPNLQNIPIRTEFSRQIRKAFLPKEGWLMVSADYSQIELRILAHLTQEPVLVEAYKTNQDVHTVTAKLLFEKETVTPDERRLGKTINFGVIYGMGAQRFARSVEGVSPTQAKLFIERFNQRYSRVFEYLNRVKKDAIAQGYVSTILGRRRYFKFEGESVRKLKDSDVQDINLATLKNIGQNDAQLLRAAANAPIQGSSADIIKVAMVKLHDILKDRQARLLLQVHDELVLEVPPDEWEELQHKIKNTMENAVELSVPLVVDIHAGQNWMETK